MAASYAVKDAELWYVLCKLTACGPVITGGKPASADAFRHGYGRASSCQSSPVQLDRSPAHAIAGVIADVDERCGADGALLRASVQIFYD